MTTPSARHARSGSSPGARACTATRRSPGRRRSRRRSSPTPRRASDGIPVADRREAGAHRRRRRSAARCSRPTPTTTCVGVIAWMHTFSPGEDVDRRPRRAAQAAAAPAHPGQRDAAVGDDRHGLHEPQPGRPRRPGVRLHPDPARRRPQDRRRPRQRPGRRRRGSARWARAARGRAALRTHAAGPLRRQHARRRRHRGRQGRGRDRASASRSTPTASTTSSPSSTRSADADVDALVAEYEDTYDVGARAAPRRRPARVAALRRPHRARPARVPRRRRLHAPSPPTSRTSAGCASCPAWPCSG